MSQKVCLLTALAVVGAMALLIGCKSESPKVTATSNDLFKDAHESLAELKGIIAKGDARKTHTAINSMEEQVSVLSGWLAPEKGSLDERKKCITDARAILSDEVMPLADASPIDQAKINAKLDEVDKLISQAE